MERGASHYQRDFDPLLPPDNPTICNEEIGIAFCLGQHSYNLDNLRAAAQLLSSPRVDAAKLCRLAIRERSEPVLLHIAVVAERFAPLSGTLGLFAPAPACAASPPARRSAALEPSGESYRSDAVRWPPANRLAPPP